MSLYLWVKAGHIVSVIAWMAALLYLPRLFVYHASVQPGSDTSQMFKVMERRLLRGIATPSMLAAWGFGLWLVLGYVGFADGWLHLKLVLVIALSAYHGYAVRWQRAFARDANTHDARFYRFVNEVPALIMVAVVVLVVVKPF